MGRVLTRTGRQPSNGDLVVVKVAGHYQVCRAQVNGERWLPMQAVTNRSDALMLACRLVTESQRVFLYADSGKRQCIEIDCA
jgi:hypothetical protein